MNNFFATITSWYKKTFSQTKGIYRKKGMRPGADWTAVVAFLVFFGVCSACVHLFIYIGVKNSSWWHVETESVVSQVSVDQQMLSSVLERFRIAQESLSGVYASSSVVADPSL